MAKSSEQGDIAEEAIRQSLVAVSSPKQVRSPLIPIREKKIRLDRVFPLCFLSSLLFFLEKDMNLPCAFRVLQPEGVLSAATARKMLEVFDGYLEQSIPIILIDLQYVPMIDSFGLGIIISMRNKMKLKGGAVYLCGLQKQARFLVDISALDRLFDVLPDQATFHDQLAQGTLPQRMVLPSPRG